MRLIDLTVNEFVKEVDSNSPAPGGGSVAALASDIGVGLARMMAHLSFNKKSYKELSDEIKYEFVVKFEKLSEIRLDLNKLIDEDTKSFNEFMKAVKMPKDTFKQQLDKQKALENATLYSIKIPYKTAKLSLEAMKELEFFMKYGNKNAITDIGVGTLMLYAGLEGAILNVKVNLSNLEDESLAKKYREICEEILTEGKKIKDVLMEKVHTAVK